MITPGKLDLVVQRWTPFVVILDFEGYDFSGESTTFALQARLYRDAPGSPILSLTKQAANAEGISCTVTTTEGIPTSHLQIRINETTAETILLNAGKAGADVVLKQDLHITGAGVPKTRWIEGDLIIRAGATQ